MNVKKDMKDAKHPYEKIRQLSKVILSFSPRPPNPVNLSINAVQQRSHLFEETQPSFNVLKPFAFNPINKVSWESLQPEIYHQVALNSTEFYERYKALYLELSFLINKEDKNYLQSLNQFIAKKAGENQAAPATNAWREWRKEVFKEKSPWVLSPYSKKEFSPLDKRRRELIVQCYLYHVILEKVYFKYMGLSDDAVLKKLFSQGIVVHGLADMYFRYEQHIMDYLYNVGLPLGMEYENSLINLNHGKKNSYTYPMRSWTLDTNIYRLGFLRIRRFIISLNDIFAFQDLNWWMSTVDPLIRACMSVINFLYFFPRFLSHLLMIFKHLFIYEWMTKEEKELSMWQRFQIQWHRRWEILFRDSLWLANGILNLFVFLGSWGVWSLPINAFFQFLEVVLNMYLLFDFFVQKQHALNYFQHHHVFKGLGIDDRRDDFFKAYHERFDLEEKNRYQRLVNSILVLVSNLLVCAAFVSISLYFPLVGAIIGVLMTFVQLYTRYSWEKEKNKITEPFELPAMYSPGLAPKSKQEKIQDPSDKTDSNLGLKHH